MPSININKDFADQGDTIHVETLEGQYTIKGLRVGARSLYEHPLPDVPHSPAPPPALSARAASTSLENALDPISLYI